MLDLSDQRKFSLNEINEIKYYFHSEFQEGKIMNKTKQSKYIAVFGCFEKTLTVFSATSGKFSIISFTVVIGIAARTASASI